MIMKKIHNNFLVSSKQKLTSLLGHYKAQRYDEAEKLALSITQKFPNVTSLPDAIPPVELLISK